MSLKKNQSFAVFPAKRGAEKSATLIAAMAHVKDFMTDAQKSLILLREGKTALDAGNLKGALDCFTQGIIFNPTVSLFNYRAICHKQLDMYNEAYFDYSYNIRLEPENGAHYCNRGLCLAKLKKFNLAVEDLNSAILYEPTAGNYFARACVFVDFGRFADAVKGAFFLHFLCRNLVHTDLRMCVMQQISRPPFQTKLPAPRSSKSK